MSDQGLATVADATAAQSYADRGEIAFRTGNYSEAVYDWRHALLDDSQNGTLAMMLAQALFASGSYQEAAGATQWAMSMLPPDQWGVVVKNYTDLYPVVQNYTDQLRALEKARNEKPSDPALRFLLGFHYYYLGYPAQATRELEKEFSCATRRVSRKLLSTIKGVAVPAGPGSCASTGCVKCGRV